DLIVPSVGGSLGELVSKYVRSAERIEHGDRSGEAVADFGAGIQVRLSLNGGSGSTRNQLALINLERGQGLCRANYAVDGRIAHHELSILSGQLAGSIDSEVARAGELQHSIILSDEEPTAGNGRISIHASSLQVSAGENGCDGIDGNAFSDLNGVIRTV